MSAVDALVLSGPRELERRSFARPDIGEDDGILRVEACGLCGTDHELWAGLLPSRYEFVPGHEIIGVVEELGPVAEQRWGVRAGDRVAVEVFQRCGRCGPCVSGDYRWCEHHGLRDQIGNIDVQRAPGIWGGYATHLYLPPDSLLLPVPDGLDPVLATVFNPLGAGLRWTQEVGQVGEGDVVAVLGPGMRGLCSAVAAKEAGAGFVLVAGAGERDRLRLELARDFGADLVVDVLEENPRVALKAATGGLADVVVDVTANAPAAFPQGIGLARPRGRMVVAGTRGPAAMVPISPDRIVFKELTIVGAVGVDATNYERALAIIASGRYPFAAIDRQVADLDATSELLGVMSGEHGGVRPTHGVVVP